MRAFNLVRNFYHLWLLLVIVMSDLTNGGFQGPIDGYNSLDEITTTIATVGYTHPKWLEPYFDPSTPRNVTALMGKSAYLSCRVRNLGNKTVSWIRHRDIHILTVGAYTYTSDQRFQATHHQDTDDWTLQIKWAQKRDAGMYECQISTQPVRSYFVRLNVVVPTATILGGPDLHVDKGSTINLTCTVKFSPEPPAYIFWYHHEEVINYDSSRGGVSVITEKGDITTSFLLIQNADLADSGKYSCAPSNADVASVRVHVLNGEHPEAMQTGSSGCQYSWITIWLLVCSVLCYNQRNLTLNTSTNLTNTCTTEERKMKPRQQHFKFTRNIPEMTTNACAFADNSTKLYRTEMYTTYENDMNVTSFAFTRQQCIEYQSLRNGNGNSFNNDNSNDNDNVNVNENDNNNVKKNDKDTKDLHYEKENEDITRTNSNNIKYAILSWSYDFKMGQNQTTHNR